jgi:hypothetical protein
MIGFCWCTIRRDFQEGDVGSCTSSHHARRQGRGTVVWAHANSSPVLCLSANGLPYRAHTLFNRCSGGRTTGCGRLLLVARAPPVVEPIPIVVASGFIGNPGLERGPGGVLVVVPVILAIVPVVPLVRLAVRSPPPVVDVDVIVLLVVDRLLLVLLIVLIKPLTGLVIAEEFGAIRFAVREVSIGVVVLGVLTPLTRYELPGQDRRSREHHCRHQRQQ